MKEGEKYPYEFARQNFRTYEILEVSDMLLSVEQLLNCIVTPFKEYFQLSRKRQKRGCQLVHAADIAESFRSETSFSPDLKGSHWSICLRRLRMMSAGLAMFLIARTNPSVVALIFRDT